MAGDHILTFNVQVDDKTVTVSSEAGTYTLPRNGDIGPCAGAGGEEEGNVAGAASCFPQTVC